MEIIYLRSSSRDVKWFREYFEKIFPDGHLKAYNKFQLMEGLLSENPYLGYKLSKSGARELQIPRTHFSFIYRINGNRIEVLRMWDSRRARNLKN